MTDTLVVNKRKTASARKKQGGRRLRRDPRGVVLAEEAFAAGHQAHCEAREQGFKVTTFVDGVLHIVDPDGTTRPFAASPTTDHSQSGDSRHPSE